MALSIEVSNNLGIGSFIQSPKYTLLIKNNIGLKLSLSLIPKDVANSDAAKQLFTDAENTRISNVKLVQAEKDAKAAAAKTVATKKTTITCVKGKLIKKVSAVKPKCPAGYKKK
jgi:hypothetical protein